MFSGIISSATETYPVMISESGLPAGTLWSASLNGSTQNSTSSTILFLSPNGPWPWEAWVPSGLYAGIPAAGFLDVEGAEVTQGVTFVRGFTVTFTEAGLHPGTPWYVEVPYFSAGTLGRSINVTEPNGTLTFGAFPEGDGAPYFWSALANGIAQVQGAPISILVRFVEVYELNFTVANLPSSTNWSVTLAGNSSAVVHTGLSSTTANEVTESSFSIYSTLLFFASIGSYSYSARAPGYSNINGTIGLHDSRHPNVMLDFAELPSIGEVALMVGATVGATVGLLVVTWYRHRRPPEGNGAQPA